MATLKGVCHNDECDWIDQIQEAEKSNFVCQGCGKELIPFGNNKTSGGITNPVKIGIGAAILATLGIGGYFLIGSSPKTDINNIRFENSEGMLFVGTVDTLRVITDPADTHATYIWSTDNDAVAVVDNQGVVSGIAAGEATITAKLKEDESISTSMKYYVEEWELVDVQSMEFMEKEKDLVLTPGSQKTLNIDCTPGNANESVFFKSENTQVATVTDNGLLTAISPGTTTITATSDRTKTSISIQVKVKNESTPKNFIDLGYATYEGDLKNGKPEGNGTMTFKQRAVVPGSKGDEEAQPGEYAQGKWCNGEVNLVTLYKKDGNRPILTHK